MFKRLINNKISNKLTFKYSYTYNDSRLNISYYLSNRYHLSWNRWNSYV